MIGCLCLHGFTGNPWEIEPVTTYFFEEKKWLVYTPTLPGHEPKGSLKGVSYKEWVLKAEIAVQELLRRCKKVYVIGHSMGGMLACYIAAKYPVTKLVLLSTAVYYVSPLQQLQELKEVIRHRFTGGLPFHYQRYQKKIMETPLSAVYQFITVTRRLRPFIRRVEVPTLIIQGERDAIVPRKGALYLFKTIRSKQKEIRFFRESNHLICHGVERGPLIDKIEDFLCS